MIRTVETAFADPDLADMFATEPELLAIADAIIATTPKPTRRRAAGPRALSRRSLERPSVLSVTALVAAAVAVALIAPWQRSRGTLADLALAAIGSEPVVHVVTETPTGTGLIYLTSGAAQPMMQRDEIWYDAHRGLRRDLTRNGSTIVDDELETPEGAFTSHGIVYDCAWIAAHPIAATQARVSCNPSGNNGTTPKVIARPKPTLDPGLAGFADSYRNALASGQARDAGTGTVDGKPVDWLTFPTSDGGTERVAIDATSHKPILLEGPNLSVRIDTIESIPYAPPDFARPTPTEVPERPSSTSAADGAVIPLSGAAIANAFSRAVWPGAEVLGLPLVRAVQQSLSASFANQTAPPQNGPGLEIDYGTLDHDGHLDRSKPYVEIQEAQSPMLATMSGFIHGGFPPAGLLYADPLPNAGNSGNALGVGATVINGVYVVIQTQNTTPQGLIAVARALTQP